MTEKVLYLIDRAARIGHVGPERVPQLMRRHGPRQPGPPPGGGDQRVHRGALLPTAVAVSKQRGCRSHKPAAQRRADQVEDQIANTLWNTRAPLPLPCYSYCMIPRSGEIAPLSVFKSPLGHKNW
jgi:hypothetical protein